MSASEKPKADPLPPVTRRSLMAVLPLANAALAAEASDPSQDNISTLRFQPRETIRIGVIGTGNRGGGLVDTFLGVGNVQVLAICDTNAEAAAKAKDNVEKVSGNRPMLYTGGERDFERLCVRPDLDLVVVATPWKWHVPMAVYAMEQGKHVALEVPAATTIEDCWTLVRVSEKTRRHCILLENCCFGYNEMLVRNMIRAGKLGQLTHGAGGYLHDIREKLISETRQPWLRQEYMRRNGNLYPTHGLGPIAMYMDIHRGDRLASIVSFSSPSNALIAEQRRRRPNAPVTKFACGDQNTSLIRTERGLLIRLEHNVSTPEPYDRINLIAGSDGIFRDYPPRMYRNGANASEEWEPLDGYKAFEDPLWAKVGERARADGGHDGMDYMMCYRLIECMRQGLAPDTDVYDAAAWSAAGPLSEQSVAAGGAPVLFPDFTRGRWKSRG